MDEDPPRRTRPVPFVQSDMDGWCQYISALRGYCECGHVEWHHRGLREPGCSYLGSCACECYRPTARRWQKPSAA